MAAPTPHAVLAAFRSRYHLLLPVLGVAIGLVHMVTSAVDDRSIGYDLAAYQGAWRNVLSGASPYGASTLGDYGAFWYPPFAALASAPIAALSLRDATFLLGIFSLGLLAFVLYRILGGGRQAALLTFIMVSSPMIRPATLQGNASTLVAALLGAAWLAEREGRHLLSGAIIGLGGALRVTPGLLLVRHLLHPRDRRSALAILGAVTALGVALIVTLPIGPLRDAWPAYPGVLAGIGGQPVPVPKSVSIPDILSSMGADTELLRRLLPIVAVVMIALGKRLDPSRGFVLTILALQVGTPLAWYHYATIWLPALAVLWVVSNSDWLLKSLILAAGFAAGLAIALPTATGMIPGFWAPGLVILLGLIRVPSPGALSEPRERAPSSDGINP